MKKTTKISVLFCLFAVLSAFLCFSVSANTETIDGVTYKYTVTNGKATITGVDIGNNTEVNIPATLGGYPVTAIGDYVLCGCKNLKTVTIPDSITRIGFTVFSGSPIQYNESDNGKYLGNENNPYLLLVYVIDNTVTDFSFKSDSNMIAPDAFYGCSELENITIPDNIKSIGSNAFSHCSKLKSVTLPNGLKSIEWGTFFNCKSLTSIILPDSITSISGNAFNGCDSLESINIFEGVKSIGDYAFGGCKKLTIYCEAESEPEGWSNNWNISNCPVVWNNKTETTKPGDIDNEDKITAKDYLMIKRGFLGTYALTEEQEKIADVDNSGNISAKDYLMVKRHFLGTFTIPGWKEN